MKTELRTLKMKSMKTELRNFTMPERVINTLIDFYAKASTKEESQAITYFLVKNKVEAVDLTSVSESYSQHRNDVFGAVDDAVVDVDMHCRIE